ncbi:hypothetical protein [Streptomyces sp. NPDC059743]|uniref:hypothetical protein n=1 Tax=Streptomyces sp. NPDC059743 TaxID=3346928 RepID=UPI00364E9CEB
MAAMCRYHPHRQCRLIYRYLLHDPYSGTTKGGRRSFSWTGYRDLLIAVHRQLGAPLVVVWDNLTTHRALDLRGFDAKHDWITEFQLPPYAAGINPDEGMTRGFGPSSDAATKPYDRVCAKSNTAATSSTAVLPAQASPS